MTVSTEHPKKPNRSPEDRLEAIQSLSYTSISLPRVYTSPRMEKASRGRQKGYKVKTKED